MLITTVQFVCDGLYRFFYWLCCCGVCEYDSDSDEEEKEKRDN